VHGAIFRERDDADDGRAAGRSPAYQYKAKETTMIQMKFSRRLVLLAMLAVAWIPLRPVLADEAKTGPSTEVKAEYLMTYVAYLDLPYQPDPSLLIFNVKPGGWAKGPGISGTFVAPGADWLRIMPSGVLRLDVRATLKTDDGDYIYITYNGIIQHSKESAERMSKGDTLTWKDIPYFVTAPTFQTSSKKYGWLNSVQAINKVVEVKVGEGGYVKYDVFVMR
jgi:Protein of unknown function (DUF3237)